MSEQVTYLQFHLAFLLPVLLVLTSVYAVRRRQSRVAGRSTDTAAATWRNYWLGVAIVAVVALVYTTPWDNYLIVRGVWWYGEGTVLGTVGAAPIEEYLFILVQPVVTGVWLALLSYPTGWPRATFPKASRLGAVALAGGIGLLGWRWLGSESTFYLGAILAWSAPVLAVQWAVGAPQLWARRRVVAVGTLLPTGYLSIADRIAIESGIWVLSPQFTTGINVAGLPIEEGAFFLLTNLFVVQGLLLYRLVIPRWQSLLARRNDGDDTANRTAEYR